ncbi:MAG: M28 family peptidase [Acidobacteriota bacterium]
MSHAREVVGFGPRPAGSDALERTRVYIETTLKGYGLTVRRDPFTGQTPRGPIPMANLIAEVEAVEAGANRPILILSGHYDTAQFQGFDFVGANDAGSSTAILVEIGRVLAEYPPPMPVWLVFFDGEEALVSWGPEDSKYGSRYMAERLQHEGKAGDLGAMILFDMIGDRNLEIKTEMNSTRWLSDLVWTTAAEIGNGAHFSRRAHAIDDDHLPFIEAGIPSLDLIDLDYGPGNRYWHAPFDTIDKIGAGSFQVVGETVLSALPALAEHLGNR